MWLNTDRISYRRYTSYIACEDHDWYACNVTFYCHAVQLQITTQHHKKVLLICFPLNYGHIHRLKHQNHLVELHNKQCHRRVLFNSFYGHSSACCSYCSYLVQHYNNKQHKKESSYLLHPLFK